MRDKAGNMYAVENGKVKGRIMDFGDSKLDSQKVKEDKKKKL